jgi:hypothetical protein
MHFDFLNQFRYGLHWGWAIEGAIGSELKVDATYLSPDVNITARLECLTKTYGVPILVSEAFHSRLSDAAASACRLIDRVTVKGSSTPMDIFAYELWQELPSRWEPLSDPYAELTRRLDLPAPMSFDRTLGERIGIYSMGPLTSLNSSPIAAPAEHKQLFERGIRSYLNGNWIEAINVLNLCHILCPEDQPPRKLLGYINEEQQSAVALGFGLSEKKAPVGWRGFRELTDK